MTLKDNDALDLAEAYMLIEKDESKIMAIRINILHLVDRYSENNIAFLVKNAKLIEHYVITGDIIK